MLRQVLKIAIMIETVVVFHYVRYMGIGTNKSTLWDLLLAPFGTLLGSIWHPLGALGLHFGLF